MVKSVYYWGNFIDKGIFELMLRLVYLYQRSCFKLHIIWVAETRQKAAQIDVFKRGCFTAWISLSGSIVDFVLLNDTSFERSVSLLPWFQILIGAYNVEPLTPEGWFEEGHGFKSGKNNDNGIWMPYHSKGTFCWHLPLQW